MLIFENSHSIGIQFLCILMRTIRTLTVYWVLQFYFQAKKKKSIRAFGILRITYSETQGTISINTYFSTFTSHMWGPKIVQDLFYVPNYFSLVFLFFYLMSYNQDGFQFNLFSQHDQRVLTTVVQIYIYIYIYIFIQTHTLKQYKRRMQGAPHQQVRAHLLDKYIRKKCML